MGYQIDELLTSVFKIVHGDQNIVKYLYYRAENGNFDILAQSDVDNAGRDDVVKKTGFEVDLIDLTDTTEKRGRIGIFLQNATPGESGYVTDERVRIEIYMPIRNFEEYDYRIAYIVGRLNTLLLQENLAGGFGKLQLESSNRIGKKVNGYDTYYHDYSTGSIKALDC